MLDSKVRFKHSSYLSPSQIHHPKRYTPSASSLFCCFVARQFMLQIHARFWRKTYRRENAVAYKKLQIWGMDMRSMKQCSTPKLIASIIFQSMSYATPPNHHQLSLVNIQCILTKTKYYAAIGMLARKSDFSFTRPDWALMRPAHNSGCNQIHTKYKYKYKYKYK